MPDKANASPRSGKELFDATVPFAGEFRSRSWWSVGSTLVVLVAVLTAAAIAPWWPLRLAASIIGGLVLVRVFILYHDFMHGSLLPNSLVCCSNSCRSSTIPVSSQKTFSTANDPPGKGS